MLHSRALNNEINRHDGRALGIVYSDYKPSFNIFLEKDGSLFMHYKTIQISTIMLDVQKNNPVTYNLKARKEIYSKNPKAVKCGTEATTFLAPKI